MTITPDDVFGISIFAFFVLAVLTFIYISWQFFTKSEAQNKTGERIIMWASLVGVILVLVYAIFAFLFKIII
ncbi:MAG: hypothetical protein OEY97_09850 [Nitrospirota bacterium]|nr:hypothetical protein [Nitrospirota bacterium]